MEPLQMAWTVFWKVPPLSVFHSRGCGSGTPFSFPPPRPFLLSKTPFPVPILLFAVITLYKQPRCTHPPLCLIDNGLINHEAGSANCKGV